MTIFLICLKRNLKRGFVLCSIFVAVHGAAACPHENRTFFIWKLQSHALDAFFGNYRGSYLGKNQLVSLQMADLLEVDYASSGQAISSMPSLGGRRYLDVGQQYHSLYPNDAGAVILSPCGEIEAAAIYWQRSVLPLGYGVGPIFFTIFVKQSANSFQVNQQINIFDHFGILMGQAPYIGAVSFQRAVHNASLWSVEPIKFTIPTTLVYLHDH
jgi:hypothetical protein